MTPAGFDMAIQDALTNDNYDGDAFMLTLHLKSGEVLHDMEYAGFEHDTVITRRSADPVTRYQYIDVTEIARVILLHEADEAFNASNMTPQPEVVTCPS